MTLFNPISIFTDNVRHNTLYDDDLFGIKFLIMRYYGYKFCKYLYPDKKYLLFIVGSNRKQRRDPRFQTIRYVYTAVFVTGTEDSL